MSSEKKAKSKKDIPQISFDVGIHIVGMTLRMYLAGQIAAQSYERVVGEKAIMPAHAQMIARKCLMVADALIAQDQEDARIQKLKGGAQ